MTLGSSHPEHFTCTLSTCALAGASQRSVGSWRGDHPAGLHQWWLSWSAAATRDFNQVNKSATGEKHVFLWLKRTLVHVACGRHPLKQSLWLIWRWGGVFGQTTLSEKLWAESPNCLQFYDYDCNPILMPAGMPRKLEWWMLGSHTNARDHYKSIL